MDVGTLWSMQHMKMPAHTVSFAQHRLMPFPSIFYQRALELGMPGTEPAGLLYIHTTGSATELCQLPLAISYYDRKGDCVKGGPVAGTGHRWGRR